MLCKKAKLYTYTTRNQISLIISVRPLIIFISSINFIFKKSTGNILTDAVSFDKLAYSLNSFNKNCSKKSFSSAFSFSKSIIIKINCVYDFRFVLKLRMSFVGYFINKIAYLLQTMILLSGWHSIVYFSFSQYHLLMVST
jgi:hypothetical protein